MEAGYAPAAEEVSSPVTVRYSGLRADVRGRKEAMRGDVQEAGCRCLGAEGGLGGSVPLQQGNFPRGKALFERPAHGADLSGCLRERLVAPAPFAGSSGLKLCSLRGRRRGRRVIDIADEQDRRAVRAVCRREHG